MDWRHLLELLQWLGLNAGLIAGVSLVALFGHMVVVNLLLRVYKKTRSTYDERVVARGNVPTRWIVVGAAVWLVLDLTSLPLGVTSVLRHLISVALMILTAWLLIRTLRVACELFLSRYSVDGKVWGLQVINANERSIELRALMGARNASEAWNLRCRIREELLEFIRIQQPESLPRLRIQKSSQASQVSFAGMRGASSHA